MVAMGLGVILLLAHLTRLFFTLWPRLCPFGAEPRGVALFLSAAVTPLLGFYVLLYADCLRGTRPVPPRPKGGAGCCCRYR